MSKRIVTVFPTASAMRKSLNEVTAELARVELCEVEYREELCRKKRFLEETLRWNVY